MELCDACEGTGLLGFQRETCWFCGGTGKKKVGKQMDRQKVLDVLNSLEVIETKGVKKLVSTKELIEVLQKHPDHELVFMYPSYEGTDHTYTLGNAREIIVDEYTVSGDGRVWLRYENEDEMFDDFCDDIASSMFDKFPLTDEQNELVERLAREEIEKIEWKKAIVVYICP